MDTTPIVAPRAPTFVYESKFEVGPYVFFATDFSADHPPRISCYAPARTESGMALRGSPVPFLSMLLHLGQAHDTREAEAAAFGAARDTTLVMGADSVTLSPEQLDGFVGWLRRLDAAGYADFFHTGAKS